MMSLDGRRGGRGGAMSSCEGSGLPVRASRGDTSRRRLRRHGSRGMASVEYGLLVALIGAALCLGLGVTVKTVFADSIGCMLAAIQGQPAPAGCGGGGGGGGPGGGGNGGGGNGGGGGGGGGPVTECPDGSEPDPDAPDGTDPCEDDDEEETPPDDQA